jgi:hypothetical protein
MKRNLSWSVEYANLMNCLNAGSSSRCISFFLCHLRGKWCATCELFEKRHMKSTANCLRTREGSSIAVVSLPEIKSTLALLGESSLPHAMVGFASIQDPVNPPKRCSLMGTLRMSQPSTSKERINSFFMQECIVCPRTRRNIGNAKATLKCLCPPQLSVSSPCGTATYHWPSSHW